MVYIWYTKCTVRRKKCFRIFYGGGLLYVLTRKSLTSKCCWQDTCLMNMEVQKNYVACSWVSPFPVLRKILSKWVSEKTDWLAV